MVVAARAEGTFGFALLMFNCKYMIAWALILPLRSACADVTGMRTRLCFFLSSHLMQDDETHKDIQQECVCSSDELSLCSMLLLITELLGR